MFVLLENIFLKVHLSVISEHKLCYVWWTCFSTDSRHIYGYKPLLTDLFIYSHEADFIQGLLNKNEKKLAKSFNFTFRYIDDVLSLNNSRFGDFVDRIYPIELKIKDTTYTDRSASYLDLHLKIDSEGRLRTKIYYKRDDFNFPVVNFPFICGNIPAAPAYGVYISQMIRYSRACASCGSYQRVAANKEATELRVPFVKAEVITSKICSRHHDLVDRYGISVSQMTKDMFQLS